MLLPAIELTRNFLSTNLKIVLKILQRENFKKHLMTKKRITQQPKKLTNMLRT